MKIAIAVLSLSLAILAAAHMHLRVNYETLKVMYRIEVVDNQMLVACQTDLRKLQDKEWFGLKTKWKEWRTDDEQEEEKSKETEE